MLKTRKRLIGVVLILVGLLLLTGVVLLGLHYWRQHKPFKFYPPVNPVKAFKPADINPALALKTLAGVEDGEVFDEAVGKGELETAYATLLFSARMPEPERLGRWLLLAEAYAPNDAHKAAVCYGQAYKLALLSPYLSDAERAEGLLQVGRGLANIGKREQALFAYGQAELLILRSPFLKKAQRELLADTLKQAYTRMGQRDKARAVDEALVDAPEPVNPPEPVLSAFVTPVSGESLSALRETAAFELQSAVEANPEEVPEKLKQALAEELRSEDEVRRAYYEEQLAAEERLSHRAGLLWDEIAWLTLKYRVSVQGFGLSLVPEWEEDSEGIAAELSKAYEALYAVYAEEAVALPEEEQVNRARAEIYRDAAARALLGLYPEASLEKLITGVEEYTALAAPAGGLKLKARDESTGLFVFEAGP